MKKIKPGSSKKASPETENYVPPTSPVKIPKGDPGFNLVKKSYKRNYIKEAGEIENYEPPVSPVKIPDNDTGFNLVKNNYRRFIWTWDEYIKKKPKFQKT